MGNWLDHVHLETGCYSGDGDLYKIVGNIGYQVSKALFGAETRLPNSRFVGFYSLIFISKTPLWAQLELSPRLANQPTSKFLDLPLILPNLTSYSIYEFRSGQHGLCCRETVAHLLFIA